VEKKDMNIPQGLRRETTNGPAALAALKDVRNIMCVAFGAFDRYYICWQGNDGKYYQGQKFPLLTIINKYMLTRIGPDSQSLPTRLESWLSHQMGAFAI
jgi:hypothetical protein